MKLKRRPDEEAQKAYDRWKTRLSSQVFIYPTLFLYMSFVAENLKSATDDNIPSFLRTPENGTTTDVNHACLMEFGRIGKGARIINNDASANLDVRLHDPNATIMIVPPSSELVIEEWFSNIFIEPDGTTGTWQLTLELALLVDAQRRR